MRRMNKFLIVVTWLAVISIGLLHTTVAYAHNAGHIHLPNGECVDVGSGKHAPTEYQDKIPGPGDQYGARWAAELGDTPIYPLHCDEPGAHDHP